MRRSRHNRRCRAHVPGVGRARQQGRQIESVRAEIRLQTGAYDVTDKAVESCRGRKRRRRPAGERHVRSRLRSEKRDRRPSARQLTG